MNCGAQVNPDAVLWKQAITMAVKSSAKAVAALTALKSLQADAKRKGLDRMPMDEINTEIAAYRREKRAKVKSNPKAR